MSIRHTLSVIISAAAIGMLAFSCSKDTGDLAATVNGNDITVESLDERTEAVKMQYDSQGIPYEDVEGLRAEVLDNMIANELLLDFANENGYAVSAETVNDQFDGIASQFGSPEEFAAALESRGLSEDRLKDEIRTALTIDGMLEAVVASDITVSDEDVEQFYTENPEYFEGQESVTASHIIVMVDSEDSEQKKEDARKRMEAIRQEIVDGADFAEVAREKSEGPSAPSGGSLGTFTRGQMVAPFEEAAFALEPGQLSDIVLTEFGYHIILVENKLPAGTQPLAQVSGQIREYLTNISEQEETERFIDDLKAKAEITYYE